MDQPLEPAVRPPGTFKLGLAVGAFILASVVGGIVYVVANRPAPRAPGTSPPAAPTPRIRVLAAASLATPLRAIASSADAAQIELAFAASSTHERQIASGTECDVFVAAAPGPVDRLIAQNLLDPETRRTIAENSLVVVFVPDLGRKDHGLRESAGLELLDSFDRIAVGAKGVPVGDYAREALDHAGLLPKLEAKLASYPDEPSVLAAVANGGAPVGFVYGSSVKAAPGVELAFTVDPKLHARIVYVAAVARSSKQPAIARAFVTGFSSEPWRQRLRDAGFLMPQAP